MDELLVLTYGKPLPESDKAWAEEIDRRIDAVERGEAATVDARDALRRRDFTAAAGSRARN